jgi:hypothetical protein
MDKRKFDFIETTAQEKGGALALKPFKMFFVDF